MFKKLFIVLLLVGFSGVEKADAFWSYDSVDMDPSYKEVLLRKYSVGRDFKNSPQMQEKLAKVLYIIDSWDFKSNNEVLKDFRRLQRLAKTPSVIVSESMGLVGFKERQYYPVANTYKTMVPGQPTIFADGITLGPRFFEMPPILAAIEILVAADHFHRVVVPYTTCKYGKYRNFDPRCELTLKFNEESLKPSMRAAFYLYLASADIKESDKQKFESILSNHLRESFRSVDEKYGELNTLLYILDENGKVHSMSPFNQSFLPVESINKYGFSFNKLRRDRFTGELLLISDKGVLFKFDGSKLIKISLPGLENQDIRVKDVQTISTYTMTDAVTKYFYHEHAYIDMNGNLWTYKGEQDPAFPNPKMVSGKMPRMKQLENCWGLSRCYLDINGNDWYYYNTYKEYVLSTFKDPEGKGWKYTYGGIYFNDMYGINQSGELLFRDRGYIYNAEGTKVIRAKVGKPKFQLRNAVKYLQSPDFHILMNNSNEFHVAPLGHSQGDIFSFNDTPKIVDMEYSHLYSLNKEAMGL